MTAHDRSWLSAYLDGELSGGRLRQARDHLSRCLACAAELEQMRALDDLVRESLPFAPAAADEEFVQEVLARLPSQSAPERSPSPKLWWLLPCAIVTAWAFVQAVLAVAQVVQVVARVGPATTFLESVQQWLPLDNAGGFLSELLVAPSASAWWLEPVGALAAGLVLEVAVLLLAGAGLWSWLAGWHAFERHLHLRSQ
ncbi:MAG: hypothetical protein HPY83_10820 [Anaerolineae bacterium]|nr:hypothetical protein [Anaerolineae bacterium]